jgi:hypothetical protein
LEHCIAFPYFSAVCTMFFGALHTDIEQLLVILR